MLENQPNQPNQPNSIRTKNDKYKRNKNQIKKDLANILKYKEYYYEKNIWIFHIYHIN